MTTARKTDQAASGGRLGGNGRVDAAELKLARQLAERAKAGVPVADRAGGLLGRLATVALEGGLDGEMDAHLAVRSTIRRAGTAGTPVSATGRGPCHRRKTGADRRAQDLPGAKI